MIKIGIYDRYLSTLGGGERYSCKLAEILSKQDEFDVELLTDIYSDLSLVSKRLNLDLSRVRVKLFPFLSNDYARKITSKYDIFINATYLSSLPGYAKRNIYLCYFPTRFDVDFKFIHRFLLLFFRPLALWLFRMGSKLCNGFRDVVIEEGLYEPKRFLLRRGSWSSGKAKIKFRKENLSPRIGIKNPSTSGISKMRVKINGMISGKKIFEEEFFLDRGSKKNIEISGNLKVDKIEGEEFFSVFISSDTFVPGIENNKFRDSRTLGAVLYDERRINFFKKLFLKILGYIPLFLITYPKNLNFLSSYQTIIAISEYSKAWIKKLWKRDSILLFPPVDVESFKAARKEKIILSVGRFFPEHHNKKQLEMANVFIKLLEQHPDVMNGYVLYLVGGVENKKEHLEYVDKIKKIADSYPIKVLTNLEWENLLDIFSKAEIFWHAAGMGEDEKKSPEKFEHFGITTVEAMASGCVPVVVNKGGQKEIIKNGEDGFLFDSWQELKEITIKICSGKVDKKMIARKAIENSKKFSADNFKKRILFLVGEEIKGEFPTIYFRLQKRNTNRN